MMLLGLDLRQIEDLLYDIVLWLVETFSQKRNKQVVTAQSSAEAEYGAMAQDVVSCFG